MSKIDIRKTTLESLRSRLRADILKNLAIAETCLRNPEHFDYPEDLIIECVDQISVAEQRSVVITKYFEQKTPQATTQEVSKPIRGDDLAARSPTYRKSLKDKANFTKGDKEDE